MLSERKREVRVQAAGPNFESQLNRDICQILGKSKVVEVHLQHRLTRVAEWLGFPGQHQRRAVDFRGEGGLDIDVEVVGQVLAGNFSIHWD